MLPNLALYVRNTAKVMNSNCKLLKEREEISAPFKKICVCVSVCVFLKGLLALSEPLSQRIAGLALKQ